MKYVFAEAQCVSAKTRYARSACSRCILRMLDMCLYEALDMSGKPDEKCAFGT